ncbi:MAG: PEP/pyruvate-binding domain-containing protein [bacterium]
MRESTCRQDLIVWCDEQSIPAQIGMKSWCLSRVRKSGIKTPEWFTLTTNAFLDFLVENGIYEDIRGLIHEWFKRDECPDASEIFANANVPGEIASQVMDACSRLKDRKKTSDVSKTSEVWVKNQPLINAAPLTTVETSYWAGLESAPTICGYPIPEQVKFAVRSSSIVEDTSGASMAGLYDTFLAVETGIAILDAIKGCWMSAACFRALTYLKRLGFGIAADDEAISPESLGMGVIVQQMVKPKFSGVMFTINPVSGDPSKIYIEYSRGLGKAVVSGRITPNLVVADKITHQIDRQGMDDFLDDDYIHGLTSIGKSIEKLFGCYQDIEWAIDDDSSEIIILQARPETIWNNRIANLESRIANLQK